MKIYIAHSKEFNFKEELYKPIRNSNLNSKYKIILPHEKSSVLLSREIIKKCDLMIAEVSFPATGLGIELGWASAFKCPVICVFKKDSKISGSLNFVVNEFIEYTDKEDLTRKLNKVIERIESSM